MRILHVIPSTAAGDGGPSEAVRAMARGVAARGVEVTVVATNADGLGELDVALDRPLMVDGVEYRYFARTLPGSWKFSWPMTRWLLDNVASFDVVHVHALFSYATIPGCRAAVRGAVPYVLRPLGTLSDWSLHHRGWKKRPYYRLVERSHLARAGAIHVTSSAEANDVRALGFGDRVRVIPLGVDVGLTEPRRERARVEPLRLLFLSRLHPVKGIPLLLDALGRLRDSGGGDVRLTIAGDGEPLYRHELERRVAERGLGQIVEFVGRVEGDAKARLYEQAHCFVLPSRHENFGLAVAEAMASGLPVIVSDRVGIAGDVHEAGGGIVVPLDERALADAVSLLGRAEETRRVMGERALALARSRFTWDRASEALIALYEELASARTARRGA